MPSLGGGNVSLGVETYVMPRRSAGVSGRGDEDNDLIHRQLAKIDRTDVENKIGWRGFHFLERKWPVFPKFHKSPSGKEKSAPRAELVGTLPAASPEPTGN